MPQVQITGGAFQDAEGNVLANGYLIFQLNQDAQATGVEICAGLTTKVQLDSNGNVSGTVLIWPNDVLTPINTYYFVTAYNASGQPVWGPNTQQVLSSPNPYPLTNWVPNNINNWNPGLNASTQLETNGTPNSSQTILNLVGGSGILLSESGGTVTISSNAGSSPPLPRPDSAQFILWEAGHVGNTGSWSVYTISDTLSSVGTSQTNLSPTATTGPLATGSTTNPGQTTAVVLGDQRTWIGTTGNRTCNFWSRLNLTGSIANDTCWVGLTNATSGANITSQLLGSTGITAFAHIAFVYDSRVSPNWICQTCNGTSNTHVITTVPVALSTNYKFNFVYNPGTNSVAFSINGTQVANINTTLPSNLALSCFFGAGQYQTGTGETINFEYLYADNTAF